MIRPTLLCAGLALGLTLPAAAQSFDPVGDSTNSTFGGGGSFDPVGDSTNSTFGNGGSFNPVGNSTNSTFGGSQSGTNSGPFGNTTTVSPGGTSTLDLGGSPSAFNGFSSGFGNFGNGFNAGGSFGGFSGSVQTGGNGGSINAGVGGGPSIFVNSDAVPFDPTSFGVFTATSRFGLNQIRRRFQNQGAGVDFAVLGLTRQLARGFVQQQRSGLSAEEFAQQFGIFTSTELQFKTYRSAAELAQAVALSRATREVYAALLVHTPNPGGGLPMLAALREIEGRLGVSADSSRIQGLIDLMLGQLDQVDQTGISRSAAMAQIWPSVSAMLLTRSLRLLQQTGTIPSSVATQLSVSVNGSSSSIRVGGSGK